MIKNPHGSGFLITTLTSPPASGLRLSPRAASVILAQARISALLRQRFRGKPGMTFGFSSIQHYCVAQKKVTLCRKILEKSVLIWYVKNTGGIYGF